MSVAELVGRAEIIDELCSALAGGGAGAVILGRSGVGKTAVLNAVAGRLQADFHIVPVRGTAIAAETPYGALAYLISGLPEDAAHNPVKLLQDLSRSFVARAGGKRVLVAVDNADRLDRFTIMALSQLLRRGTVAVVAAASVHWEADPELVRLWSEGLLARVDLALLTERQTRQLMQQILGAAVSGLAAATMWQETEGSPRLIRLMTNVQVHSGTLVRRESTWVRTAPFTRTGEVSEVVDTVLARLDAPERQLVEVLALCITLPLPRALELVPAAALDALEEQQVISVAGNPPRVRLSGGTPGSVIAASMAPGRRRELWEDMSPRMDPAGLEAEELTAYVGWALCCGEEPGPSVALRAARAANERADGAAALRFVRAVPVGTRSQELVCEEVRALHGAGKLAEALAAFKQIEPRLSPQERAGYVPLQLLHSQTLARVPGAGDPLEPLLAVEGSRPAEGDQPELAAALILAHSRLAADGGRVREVPDELFGLSGKAELKPSTRIHAAALSANILALSGRTSEALDILAQLGAPKDYALGPGNATEVCTRIFDTYVLSGELDRAADFVKAFDKTGIRPSYAGSAGELAVAVLAAWQGQDGAAREALTGGMGQLRVHDPHDMLPLARTLSAYLNRERHAESGESLNQAHNAKQNSGYFRGFLIRYFALQAGNNDAGLRCRRLREEAGSAQAAGYAAPALHFLAAAVQSGDRQAAADLLAAADDAGGRFGSLVSDFAAGVLHDDPSLLVNAAQGFRNLGQHLLCRSAAHAAEESAVHGSPGERRALARSARALANASLRSMQHVGGRAETLAGLSAFEADLAHRAVTLATTTQIAGELNLSPRTIEWHLGKIFAKLHVSGRSELAEILA
ncbi:MULTISPECIES: LuxR family transcriptional regulator [unclassified Arthrobacter]|uniref:helix-turn-helix transcriptional regulator n=1 Tax=unclassified Arthrobacter TaxID=235627 RepID=UPI001E5ED63A|nr:MULTISPECIES: LuxR family transcriptional regulator [unclassified Arthrobacter]MCC9146135.1 LuxR family transcriptional regulator [Arthrobacter sp. zg-Y919]MDK1277365.1 LuxR family transcriptional regulator [Arthrobacter sp. zg.Y919]WIB03862.1 LuxR family transcriptional regulator [Arthrobacter sp. zg-Y919]